MNERRTKEAFAENADATRGTRSYVLLVEDHLLIDRGAASAVFGRPTDAGPAALCQLPLPLSADFKAIGLVPGAPSATERCEVANVVLVHPRPHFTAELTVFGGVKQIHRMGSVVTNSTKL